MQPQGEVQGNQIHSILGKKKAKRGNQRSSNRGVEPRNTRSVLVALSQGVPWLTFFKGVMDFSLLFFFTSALSYLSLPRNYTSLILIFASGFGGSMLFFSSKGQWLNVPVSESLSVTCDNTLSQPAVWLQLISSYNIQSEGN